MVYHVTTGFSRKLYDERLKKCITFFGPTTVLRCSECGGLQKIDYGDEHIIRDGIFSDICENCIL